MPTLIEKTVLVNHKVQDLWGLLMDLRRADFKVRNVGSDVRGTYVHLEPDEEKDPSPIVEAWVGKAAPKPSAILKEVRTKELEKVKEQEKAREAERMDKERELEEARARGEAEAQADQPAAEAGKSPEENTHFLKKLFRKFF